MMSFKRTLRRLRAKTMNRLSYRGLDVPISGEDCIKNIIDGLMPGHYETPEIETLLHLLRSNDKVLEVGVGLGVVSGLAGKTVPSAQIECFEANPELIASIKDLHTLNDLTNINLHNEILIRGPGGESRNFYVHCSFAEGSLIQSKSTVRTVRVSRASIEEKLASFSPDILVVDIEGVEDELLSGLELQGIRGLVLELHPTVLSRAAEARIYATCLAAGLFPRVDLSSANVVAFEVVDQVWEDRVYVH